MDYSNPQNQDKSAISLSSETMLRSWQQSGARMMRAQERMLSSMMSAAKLEMQFGQTLMQNRLSLLQHTGQDTPPSPMTEIEKMLNMMREVSEELRNGFREALAALTDGAGAEAQDALNSSTEAVEIAVEQTAKMARHATKTGAQLAEKGAEAVEEAAKAHPGYTGEV